MTRKRRNHPPEFKSKVPLDAAKGDKTVAELAQKYNLHAIMPFAKIHPYAANRRGSQTHFKWTGMPWLKSTYFAVCKIVINVLMNYGTIYLGRLISWIGNKVRNVVCWKFAPSMYL
ncbi:hypothetical protein CGU03_10780 [Vibrio metoecus]|uniref:Transposase n=2 Tax=Vibrio metoecus TaxID=1481663 RepID=A0A271VS70_VIBMT|nr:hypothetical protein CGU03_10780 [Vibrio metoecus]PAR25223.1 hypothetical protein CGU02_04300 [Vibrio metoecus]